jgi:hypothetical protein
MGETHSLHCVQLSLHVDFLFPNWKIASCLLPLLHSVTASISCQCLQEKLHKGLERELSQIVICPNGKNFDQKEAHVCAFFHPVLFLCRELRWVVQYWIASLSKLFVWLFVEVQVVSDVEEVSFEFGCGGLNRFGCSMNYSRTCRVVTSRSWLCWGAQANDSFLSMHLSTVLYVYTASMLMDESCWHHAILYLCCSQTVTHCLWTRSS